LAEATRNDNVTERDQLNSEWVNFMATEAVNQYKDYFESDSEEDFRVVENAVKFDREHLLNMFENVVQFNT